MVTMFSRLFLWLPFSPGHSYGYSVLQVIRNKLIPCSPGFTKNLLQVTQTITMLPFSPGYPYTNHLLQATQYSYSNHVLQATNTVIMFSRLLISLQCSPSILLWLPCSPGYSYGYHVLQATYTVTMFSKILIQ